jgi:phosphotransferase system enzyme I (PtsP)
MAPSAVRARLLRRFRETMAEQVSAQERLDKIVVLIAANMVAEVCSFMCCASATLELYATEGLNPEAVHHTVLRRRGPRRPGRQRRSAEPADAQNIRPSPTSRRRRRDLPLLPRRADPARGNTLGVLVVQNRARRTYSEEEVEALQTTAMVLAEMIASGELTRWRARPGADGTRRPLHLNGDRWPTASALGHVVLHEPRIVVTN